MVFNYSDDPRERAAAARFRDADLPFKLRGVPALDAAVARWADDEFLAREIDDARHVQVWCQACARSRWLNRGWGRQEASAARPSAA